MKGVYQIFKWRREAPFKINISSVHKIIDYYAEDKREQ